MLESGDRKLVLSAWLKRERRNLYANIRKLQNFVILYELLSKAERGEAHLEGLMGIERGAVFLDLWEDYMRRRDEFDAAVEDIFERADFEPDVETAEIAAFIVLILSDAELGSLIAKTNYWRAKKEEIENTGEAVALDEADFNDRDKRLLLRLTMLCPPGFVDDHDIIEIEGLSFLCEKETLQDLTPRHVDTLITLAEKAELANPVFIDIDDRGRLPVD